MSETTEKDKGKRLGLARPGKLVLNKTVETGQVRQSFSRGRTKPVTVEVRRKRTYVPDSEGRLTKLGQQEAEAVPVEAPEETVEVAEAGVEDDHAQVRADHLTNEERAIRARVLEDARKAEEDARRQAEIDAARRAEEEARKAEENARREAEEAARRAAEKEAGLKATSESLAEAGPKEDGKATSAEPPAEIPPETKPAGKAKPAKKTEADEEAEDEKRVRGKKLGRGDARKHTPGPRRGEEKRRPGKLTIAAALSEEEEGERTRSLAALKRAREREKQKQRQALRTEPPKVVREVVVPETITVQELSNRMAVRGAELMKTLMRMGVMATINQSIDADTAELVATEFGHKVKRVSESDVEQGLRGGKDDPRTLKPRPPVVTVMGHVDHGKTSVLDAMRETDVVSQEAGGITQHIGAYQIASSTGGRVTFIDTPGHEAFTSMRARGAQVTDIVVLVVAADDSVMPQTIEAINHAKAAGVPLIVAINKMDVPGADPQKVRMDLLQHEIVLEAMGGDVLSVELSAKKRQGLEKLEEAILLQAEVLELKANPDRSAEGVIVESQVDLGRGPVATVLVQRGTLRVGDVFVAGNEWGRVRALVDAHGQNVDEAGPSFPVEVLGLNGPPAAGDEFVVVESEARAREISEFRQRQERQAKAGGPATRITLEQMFKEAAAGGGPKQMPVLIKGDVHGSVEAIVGSLEKMSTDEVSVKVLHTGVGAINQSDIMLAKAWNSLVVGFNVRANAQARELAAREGIEIRYYSVIYEVVDDLKKALSGLLAPTLRETILGYAEVREVFTVSKVGKVAGCRVTEGVVRRGAKVRLLRDDVVIHEGELSQLKRFKDDAKEVRDGLECGMAFANYNDIREGDRVECFETEEVAREL